LFLVPGLPSQWVSKQKQLAWHVEGYLRSNYERAEPEGIIAVGMSGACIEPSIASKKRLTESNGRCIFVVEPRSMSVLVKRVRETLCVVSNRVVMWNWAHRPPIVLSQRRKRPVTVGPTLIYRKDQQPRTVARTDQEQVDRIGRAWLT